MKRALITGVTGQDGTYLAELLLEKGYEVHGLIRRSSIYNTGRIQHLLQDVHHEKPTFILHYGDLTDSSNLARLVQQIQPDEVYNLGAMSHVKVSFDEPEYSADVDALGTLRILEAVRVAGLEKKCRIYQASTSELFGKVRETPQTELTPFYPRSPYGVAKIYGYWITVNYREAYGMHASNGILFNHESPLRGETFVTRKITRAVARIAFGLQQDFFMGNLDARRDWGHAKDYVDAIWRIVQHETPDDWVIATGVTTSVREFIRLSFHEIGLSIEFEGDAENEKGKLSAIDQQKFTELIGTECHLQKGDVLVQVDPAFYRPTEVDYLIGDSTKARTKLNWQPKYDLPALCAEMVRADVKLFKREMILKKEGYIVGKEID